MSRAALPLIQIDSRISRQQTCHFGDLVTLQFYFGNPYIQRRELVDDWTSFHTK